MKRNLSTSKASYAMVLLGLVFLTIVAKGQALNNVPSLKGGYPLVFATAASFLQQLSFHSVELYLLLLASWVFGFLFRIRTIKNPSAADRVSQDPPGPSVTIVHVREWMILGLALALAGILVWFPRSYQNLPIGADTLYYISVVETIGKEGVGWAFRFTDKPLLHTSLFLATQLTGMPVVQAFKVLPVFLGGLLTLTSWLFVREIYYPAAGLVALVTAVSTPLMRTSIDLYGSFLATSLVFLVLWLYLRSERLGSPLYPTVVLQSLVVVLLLSYWFFWVFSLGLLVATRLLHSKRKTFLVGVLRIFLPSIAILAVFVLVAFTFPRPIYWGFGSSFPNYFGRATTPYGVTTYNAFQLTTENLRLLEGEGNILLLILGALSLCLMGPRTSGFSMVYLWSGATLVLTLVNPVGTHAALFFPLSLLAGLGLQTAIERLSKS